MHVYTHIGMLSRAWMLRGTCARAKQRALLRQEEIFKQGDYKHTLTHTHPHTNAYRSFNCPGLIARARTHIQIALLRQEEIFRQGD
jgi:hypothetical protein